MFGTLWKKSNDTTTTISALSLESSLIVEARRLELRSKRRISADLIGEYRSAFRGTGLVISDIREYTPGDDVKHIHWKATARTGKVYVKSYDEDRTLRIVLALDVSRSLTFGDKARRLREFASLVGLLGEQSGDALGLLPFNTAPEQFIPPRNRRSQYKLILSEITRERTMVSGTNISKAIRHLLTYLKRQSIIFIVSDFFSTPFTEELRLLTLRHEVICVLVQDQREYTLPQSGIIQFEDAESGKLMLFDTSSKPCREALLSLWNKRVQDLRGVIEPIGGTLLVLQDDPVLPLRELMLKKKKALR